MTKKPPRSAQWLFWEISRIVLLVIHASWFANYFTRTFIFTTALSPTVRMRAVLSSFTVFTSTAGGTGGSASVTVTLQATEYFRYPLENIFLNLNIA